MCFRSGSARAVQGSAPNFGPPAAPFDDELNKIGRVVRLTTRFYKPKSRRLAQRMRRARRSAPVRRGRTLGSAPAEWQALGVTM